MFDRRKKNVCTSICWILNSPPTILLMDPLMTGVEPAGMAAHRDQPGLFLQVDDRLRIGPGICERDFDLHMLAALRHAIDCAACIWVGVQRMTASSSLSARLSARSVVT